MSFVSLHRFRQYVDRILQIVHPIDQINKIHLDLLTAATLVQLGEKERRNFTDDKNYA